MKILKFNGNILISLNFNELRMVKTGENCGKWKSFKREFLIFFHFVEILGGALTFPSWAG